MSGAFQNNEVQLQSSALLARAWCPKSALGVLAQKDSSSAPANNWAQRDVSVFLLDGFGIFTKSGEVLANGNNRDCFWWSDPPLWDITPLPNTQLYDAWGNMAQGLHLTGGIADGVWANSTDSPQPPNGNQDFLDLRNIAPGFPSNDQQSVSVVVDGSERYLVFGCPGGRVRVVHAGALNTGSAPHGIGYEASTSEDYGHGGCALAVMPDGTGIDIYFGVIVRNAVAVTYPNQPLQNSEVMTGRIVKLRFDYATDMLSPVPVWMHDLEPSSTDRGGYGVVGIHVDELFPNAPTYAEEKEVVVTTMSGDVFVFAESGPLRFRASVPGAAGFYNSILALDLNGDGRKELYIAGSMGLHRFVSPSEQGVHP